MRMIVLVMAIFAWVRQAPPALRVTFLGTGGGPAVAPEWAGPSTLIEFGREAILIDAGRGLVQRMRQLGRPAPGINTIFLTHLHSDHTVGLPEFWLRSWWGEGRRQSLEVRGPKGTQLMAQHIESAWSYDVDIRSGPPENINSATAKLVGVDTDTGIVYDRNGLRVTAIRVDHGPVLCYGYRIDAGGHSVVISGDDRQSEELIAHSQNVDVLVHDVGVWTPEQLADTGAAGRKQRAAVQLLATPDQAGTVFARSHPKLAVLYHWGHTERALELTRAAYRGRLEGADDLMEIVIGDSIAVTRRPQSFPK